MLAVVALLDDWMDLPVVLRLSVQLLVAMGVIGSGLAPDALRLCGVSWDWPWPVGAAVSLIYIIWLVNLYNFMDGMDGFAGGMAGIGFGALGFLGWMADEMLFPGLAWCAAASAAGFLIWNFPPARIFLGDSGSVSLGFLVAALTLWADRHQIAPLWASVLISSPFIVDVTVTLLRRASRGEPVWQADRKHYYQRLAGAGWGHRRTVLWEYALMISCALSAVIAVRGGVALQLGICVGWLLIYVGILVAVDRRIPFATGEQA